MINIIIKLNHWTIFLLIFFLGITGIFGCTIYSHDSIVPQLEFAYGVHEIFAGRSSQITISRLMRGLMWDWHYYAGIALTIMMFIGFILSYFKPGIGKNTWLSIRKNPLPLLFFFMVLILCVTGVLRYYRGEIVFMGEHDKFIRNLPKFIHYYSAIALGCFFLLHVVHMIRVNSTKIETLISDMFTSRDLHFGLVSIFLSSTLTALGAYTTLYADEDILSKMPHVVIIKQIDKLKEDKHYKEAMEYYSGKKGFSMEERAFPNCPYDACEKSNDVVQTVEKNGQRVYNIKIHDFKSAKALFDESIAMSKNPLSAEKNIIMISERINYKSKRYEDYLLEHVKTSLGIDGVDAINKEVQKNLLLINESNSAMMLFRAADIYENGYFGIEKELEKAKYFYQLVIDKNDTKNMYYMLVKNKIAIMTK